MSYLYHYYAVAKKATGDIRTLMDLSGVVTCSVKINTDAHYLKLREDIAKFNDVDLSTMCIRSLSFLHKARKEKPVEESAEKITPTLNDLPHVLNCDCEHCRFGTYPT